jgi:putative transposase
MEVFFSRGDYRRFLLILRQEARRHALGVWTYCLMPNHVHLIAVPTSERGLAKPLGRAHRRYAMEINRREGWKGHLWQERFASFPMDEKHLVAAMRYVLLNPVRAGLVQSAVEWPYSSARAHVLGEADPLVDCRPGADRIDDWQGFLEEDPDDAVRALRRHSRLGRPLGSDRFVGNVERITGRSIRPRRVGRPPKGKRVNCHRVSGAEGKTS